MCGQECRICKGQTHFALLHQLTSNAASGNNVKVNVVSETPSEQVSKPLFLGTVLCQNYMYVHVASVDWEAEVIVEKTPVPFKFDRGGGRVMCCRSLCMTVSTPE